MSKNEKMESKPAPIFLTVEDGDVRVGDLATVVPGHPYAFTHVFSVESVSDTHVELGNAFNTETVTVPLEGCKFARVIPAESGEL